MTAGSAGRPTMLTHSLPGDAYFAPAWSPDGRQLAFEDSVIPADGAGGEPGRQYGIYVIDADGTLSTSSRSMARRPPGRPTAG